MYTPENTIPEQSPSSPQQFVPSCADPPPPYSKLISQEPSAPSEPPPAYISSQPYPVSQQRRSGTTIEVLFLRHR